MGLDRRTFILYSCCVWLCACSVVDKPLPEKSDKINKVVVIIADDHSFFTTGAYGNEIIQTPHIDRLAEEGISFLNAFCNAPICSASRQSILTGKYPHATGVNLLFTPFPDEGNVTIAEHLSDHGYQTALIGKDHWNNWVWGDLYKEMPNHGFQTIIGKSDYEQWFHELDQPHLDEDIDSYDRDLARQTGSEFEWLNGRALPHPVIDEFSQGTFLANRAIDFIETNRDSAFFLWLSFYEPHQPYYFPIEFYDMYDPRDMPLPVGSPEDDRWIPKRYQGLTDAQKQGIIAAYYTSTSYLDKNIGLVLDAIRDQDLDEEILVIYLSDNGYLLNDHKRFEKHTMWEEAIRQPTIFRIPGRGSGEVEQLIEYVDIVPTILDLIDLSPMQEVQGKSVKKLIEGTSTQHKDYVVSTYLEDNLAMIRTKDWKYVFTSGSRELGIGYATGHGPSGIVHRLYDLKNDPRETTSLADQEGHQKRLFEMQERLIRHFMETHPDALNCPDELTNSGKLVWFCEPRDVGADPSIDPKPTRVFGN